MDEYNDGCMEVDRAEERDVVGDAGGENSRGGDPGAEI